MHLSPTSTFASLIGISIAGMLMPHIPVALAGTATFYEHREDACKGKPALVFEDLPCNTCVNPPGDWYGIYVSGNSNGNKVMVYNQGFCTPWAQVGQWYGNVCVQAGRTPLGAAYIACPGNKMANDNTTIVDGEETAEVVPIPVD
ncbi:hypothetical protein CVT24_000077 [Panaeolus cyanescens]|uniref:Uncharacterized protein n=1 Tax=Panaeolus cyanescens TaxID=181874 RepID=A0A409VSM7_9AGAR|nr:hypothetical protein CVT24_000077 [Panaeolus cyanescens]